MIPKLPIFLAITLSSSELRPKRLDYFTSFKHLAHLCTAYFVSPTRNGIINMLNKPKTSMPRTASRYPNKFVS